jgi:hypothetical protein
MIRADTSVPREIVDMLDEMPIQDLRPPNFTTWGLDVYKTGLEFGHDESKIMKWIRVFAREKGFAPSQIDALIYDLRRWASAKLWIH